MATTDRTQAPPSWWRETGRSFLEYLGITGLGVAEPVLSSFRNGADVFVLRHADAVDVVGFVAAVVLVPALVLLGFECLFSILGRRVRFVVHVALLAVAAGAVVLGSLQDRTAWGPVLLVVATLAGVALAAGAIARWPAVRLWLRYLAAFPVVLGLAFLFASPVTDIVLGRDAVTTAHGVTVGNPAPVVMIVLDELPLVSLLDAENHIDAAQFPNIARLAGDATWFRNESSVAPSTPEAVPAILTGAYPTDPDALPDAREYPDNLFTLLGGTYRENVWEGVTRLCPEDICPEDTGQSGGTLRGLLDDAADVWSRQVSVDRSEAQVTFQVRQSNPNAPLTISQFIDSLRPSGDEPRLDFLHVLYPHQPWFHTPTGAVYDAPFVAEGLDSSYQWRDQSVADAGRQRHLLQLQHADAMVGAVLDRMEELGTYDESLVLLTADHGVSFLPGSPIRGVSSVNYHQIMWTPLLVKAPRQDEAAVDDRPLAAVDVLPTIADALDVDIPWAVDGESAFADEPRTDGTRRFFEWTLNALSPTDGPYVEVDGPTGFRRMLDEPPAGEGGRQDLRFYRFGEWGRLVGRDVDELAVDGGPRHSGTLDRAADYRDVERRTGQVPAYVSGTVRTAENDISTVAVAVNGTIAGWSHLHPGTVGAPDWYTMVPEWFFVEGDNRIDLYSVSGTPADPVLSPISLS